MNTDYNNEIDDSTNQPSPKTHKIPGTSIELTTPQISTPIGVTTGLLTYEAIDEYAYQFNTWHNDIMIDKMEREDEIANMWNDMLGNFGVGDAAFAGAGAASGGGGGSVLTEALSVEKDVLLEPAASAAATTTSTDSSTTASIIPEVPLNGAFAQQQEATVDIAPTTAAPASVELHDKSMTDETVTSLSSSSTPQLSDISSSETSVTAQSSSPVSSSSLNELVSVNEGTMNTPISSHNNANTDLMVESTTGATPTTVNEVEVDGDVIVMNAPTSTSSFESGNTDLVADVTTAAHPSVTESTQYSDTNGVINGGGIDIHTPVGATQYSDGQFGSPAEMYSQTASSATVDQNSFNSFGSSESFSRWHNEASGSNPLRDLASSLPPPIERIRGTGGEYYNEAVASQFQGIQDMATTTAPPSGVDDLVDSLSSSDLSNALGIGDVGASVTSIPSDVSDSFTTQPPDASYDHLFEGAEKMKSSILSNLPEVHMDSIQDKVDAALNSQQSNALSDFASSSGASMNDALISVKENGAAKLGSLFGSASHSLGEIQDKMVSAGASSMKGLGNAAQSMSTSTLPSSLSNVDIDAPQSAQMSDALHSFYSSAPISSAIQHVNDATIADIGNGIMDAVKFMSGILLTAVDANLDLAVPGSSSASVLQSVRSSVTSMLDNASYTISSVMNDIGNLTLKDIVHNLMVLIVATADVLMKIMNAVIYVISGKDSSGWVIQATNTVDQATSQLLAQADDVTHRSFGDLAISIGEYSHHVGDELIGLLGSFNGVEGVDSTLDVVTSAIQTGLSL